MRLKTVKIVIFTAMLLANTVFGLGLEVMPISVNMTNQDPANALSLSSIDIEKDPNSAAIQHLDYQQPNSNQDPRTPHLLYQNTATNQLTNAIYLSNSELTPITGAVTLSLHGSYYDKYPLDITGDEIPIQNGVFTTVGSITQVTNGRYQCNVNAVINGTVINISCNSDM